MAHRWRQQTGAVATAQVVRLGATSLAWATVSEGTWEMRSRQVIGGTIRTFLPLKWMRDVFAISKKPITFGLKCPRLSVDPGPKEQRDRGDQGHLPRQAEGIRGGDPQTGEEG